MSGDEEALLRAVLAAPADDLPRLVYADWLDEHGDPRGEFIRVQIERARLASNDGRQEALRWREAALMIRHEKTWTIPLPLAVGQTFRRGFVERLEIDFDEFVNLSATIYRHAPVVEIEANGATADEIDRLANCPDLGRVRALVLRLYLPGSELERLLASTHLTGLRRLEIYLATNYFELTSHSLRYAHQLNIQNVRNPRVSSDRMAEWIAGAASLSSLRDLTITIGGAPGDFDRVRAAGAGAIARSRYLTNLTALDLSHNGIGDDGLAALAMSGNAATLEVLALRDNGICATGDRAVKRLCSSPFFDRLKLLDLRMNDLGRVARTLLLRRFEDVVVM